MEDDLHAYVVRALEPEPRSGLPLLFRRVMI
jgi:hypothetical protein